MPGTDPLEAMRLILDELPDLPHLVELPDRGVGADMIGRTAALLIDLPVDATTRGWRLADRPGRDLRRAQSLLARDLDALEEAADGYQGTLKLQVCGPWTMAASLELARSQEPVLADPGAVRDLTESLAEGVAAHVSGVAARVPGARLLLQVDEPALPTVLAGGVPSASGLNRVRPVEEADAEPVLRAVLSATAASTVVHCCAMSAPLGIIRGAGADGAGIDLGVLRRGEEEVLAEAIEAGLGIFAGAVPATPVPGTPAAAPVGRPRASGPAADANSPQRNRPGALPDARPAADRVVELWRRMGWPAARQPGAAGIAAQVVITPGCGLAGAPPEYARAALACCREAARMLPELIEEEAP
jgi:Cobalamin-independent synthase, Catalytic domain